MILTEQTRGQTPATGRAAESEPAYELREVNVGSSERLISAVAGGALAYCGLKSRSTLGALAAAAGAAMVYRGVTGCCPAYAALGMNTAEQDLTQSSARPEEYFGRAIHVEESVTINKTPWDLYQFWRNFENLPRFMRHLESVRVIDEKRSHWVAKAPAGTSVEWDAEIINDEPNALIAWRSVGNPWVDNAGSVRFVPGSGDRGTEVRVVVDYIPPGGRFAAAVAKLFGREPSQEIREDLRRFKQVMETGEVPTTEGQARGTGSP